MARYQRVEWRQEASGYPVVLYSEINDDGIETRKVDEYADGHLDYAGPSGSTGSTLLSEKAMPSLDEINAQAEFRGEPMAEDEFERVWERALASAGR